MKQMYTVPIKEKIKASIYNNTKIITKTKQVFKLLRAVNSSRTERKRRGRRRKTAKVGER